MTKQYKIVIAGGRDFTDKVLLENALEFLLETKGLPPTNTWEVVSGLARGADTLGRNYAIAKGIPYKDFPADWEFHGNSAGYIRNKEMAKYGDVLIAFHDTVSKGTQHMIDLAREYGLRVFVVKYNV